MPNPHPHTALALGLLCLALAPLAGCQHHTGDDWYCITLPDYVVPDEGINSLKEPGMFPIQEGMLPTGHLPLHDKDIQEIREAVRMGWREKAGDDLDLGKWNMSFDHWVPGKVRVYLESQTDHARGMDFFIYHTAEGWRVVAIWLGYS